MRPFDRLRQHDRETGEEQNRRGCPVRDETGGPGGTGRPARGEPALRQACRGYAAEGAREL